MINEYTVNVESPVGVVVVVHGAAEHAGRYAHFTQYLNRSGFSTVAVDLPGHGKSEGDAVHLNDFREYLITLAAVLRELPPSIPVIIIGHSMGGLVVARFTQTISEMGFMCDSRMVAGVVLLSPLFAVAKPVPWWKILLGRICYLTMPQMRFATQIKPEELTSDAETIEARLNDKLIHKTVTAGWYFEITKLMRVTQADAQKVSIPTAILQSDDDVIVEKAASLKYHNSLGGDGHSYELIADQKHEILNDTRRMETYAIILRKLNEMLASFC